MSDVDITKATPRPWKKGGKYRINAPKTGVYGGKSVTLETYPVVVARANQSYRNPEVDAANLELCLRSVSFCDAAMSIIEQLTSGCRISDDDMYELERLVCEYHGV